MRTLLQDLRYGLRTLTHRPAFAAVAIVTLALGIGLNAAVFTVVDAALVRSVPYAEPERLVHLWQVQDDAERRKFPLAWQTLRELQASSLFASVAGYQVVQVAGAGGPIPRSCPPSTSPPTSSTCSASVLPLGRGFLPGEDVAGGPRAVVLTDAFWRTRMGADPRVLGTTLILPATPTTVVGVLPPSFPFAPGEGARVRRGPAAGRPREAPQPELDQHHRPPPRRASSRGEPQRLSAFADALRERFPDAFRAW